MINSSQNIDSKTYQQMRAYVIDHIDAEEALKMSLKALETTLSVLVNDVATEFKLFLNGFEQRSLVREIADDMVRLGPIQPLMDDPEVSDVLINGIDQVLIERKGKLEKTHYRFRDYNHLLNLAQRIASAVGRRVDESSPMVDARLSDGSRVNIVIPPLSLNGICISIRKFTREIMDFEVYQSLGCLTGEMAEFLKLSARARLNILVSGGTGAGKTTLLNALSQHISPDERILTIEDAAELRLDQSFLVRLETRPASVEGTGEVTQRDLVRNALRMRPDRIILGEVRGAEAFDMLQAMNTGHDGSLSTIHANSPEDALLRLENMLNMGAQSMSSSLIRRQLASALDLLIQIERDIHGQRRITNVSEICPSDDFGVVCRDLFFYHRSRGGGEFRRTDHIPDFAQKMLAAGVHEQYLEVLNIAIN
ncbi:MAG: CpaF family protein [Deltaproteobacteria bacterium]|jgi:pilus assembly protein CpaF|nr:CpaF family protein [Deltaproteobacteria bacterium]